MKFTDPEARQLHKYTDCDWLQELYRHNIRHVEQVASLLATGQGKIALAAMGAPIDQLIEAVEPVVQANLHTSLKNPEPTERKRGTEFTFRSRAPKVFGYLPPAKLHDRFEVCEFNVELPTDWDAPPASGGQKVPQPPSPRHEDLYMLPLDPLPTARNQGNRGTCVAFTVASMYEIMLQLSKKSGAKPPAEMSVQYLFYHAKQLDGRPDEDGTTIHDALEALEDFGVCKEGWLKYKDRHDFAHGYVFDRGSTASLKQVRNRAKKHRIHSHQRIAAPYVPAIKQALLERRPVGVALAVFESAWYTGFAEFSGEIALPLSSNKNGKSVFLDTYLGNHAVCLVGFEDTDTSDNASNPPGGGYFVFRNSWGIDWAPSNRIRRGYGRIPYAYIERYCREACVITGLPSSSDARPSAGKKAVAKKGRKPRGE